MDFHATQAAEMLAVDVLSAAAALSGVPVRRQVDDDQKTRPMVIISASIREALIPDGLYSVNQIDLKIDIETQFAQETSGQHDSLVEAVGAAIPEIGKYTAAQPYFEEVFFGPTRRGEETQNDLVRIYSFESYLVGRLTIPT
jgi:hypothetical protein